MTGPLRRARPSRRTRQAASLSLLPCDRPAPGQPPGAVPPPAPVRRARPKGEHGCSFLSLWARPPRWASIGRGCQIRRAGRRWEDFPLFGKCDLFLSGLMPSVLMRSVSGVRGIVGEGLTPEVLVSHVHSFVQAVGRGRVLVGRDTRDSGPAIEDLGCATLALSGCDAIRLGIATTPTVEMAVLADPHAVGGIILTASHNPAEWNALK